MKLTPNIAGRFETFDDWVSGATRALAKTCPSSTATVPVSVICVDTKGRRCFQGSDFMRARDEGTFPVVYFWDCVPAPEGLLWTRFDDGHHNGRPTYEYVATSGTREYTICWAYDNGGTFGYSAVDQTTKEANDGSPYLTKSHGIIWAKTLKRCKAECQKIEDTLNRRAQQKST